MIFNYLKTAIRNLRRNRLYAVINIAGLMIGLATSLLIGLYISHELSYDQFHDKKERIVRATMEYSAGAQVQTAATTGTKAGPQLKRMFPEIEKFVRTFIAVRVVKKENETFEEPGVLYADEAFFKIFSFPLLEGNANTVLNSPDNALLSASMASKYFGSQPAIGKTITIGNKNYQIAGIFQDIPQNSQIKFDFVTRFLNLGEHVAAENWWTANWITYFLLKEHTSIPQLQSRIASYMNSPTVKTEAGLEGNDYLRYNLEPLKTIHLHSSLAGFEPNGSIRHIYIFGLIALLIVLIASANYTNLATAQSMNRSGEIGIRKVMGASRRQLFLQFIGESSAITFIAAILALVLAGLLIPYFNKITGKHFTSTDVLQPLPVLILLALAVLTSFIAGLYPALILSGMQILGVLKKGFNFTGSTNLLRKSLIVAQFAIAVFLIIYTAIIVQQMQFMQHKKLGYDKEHLVILPVDSKMGANYEIIKTAISQTPGVTGITASYETPEFVEWSDGISVISDQGKKEISLNAMPVDLNFTSTLKMEIIAGRDFQENDFSLMDTSHESANFRQPFVINESLARTLGWTPESAIGKIISKGQAGPVLGVVKDFHFESLHQPVKPLVLFLNKDLARTFIVRLSANKLPEALKLLEQTWKERVTHRPFEYHFLDEDYNRLYLAEQRSTSLFTIAGTIAIILACLGLFGLAAFTTVQRRKEIGIRRILGAGIGNISLMIAKNFLVLVGISILIAIPLALLAGIEWLNGFAYRIAINPFIFLLAAAAVLFIAWATVSFQAIKAAIVNPVKSLRTE